MLLFDQVAGTFLGVWFLLLLRFVLEKYGLYTTCSSDIALFNKKNLLSKMFLSKDYA